jgi:hypothetical protein
MTGAVQAGPRCGWPDRCTAPDSWHAPRPGERRSWGYHDVQCPVLGTDPRLHPDCSLTADHSGLCEYSRRRSEEFLTAAERVALAANLAARAAEARYSGRDAS